MKVTELVLESLRNEGFRPQIDETNGNILFKYQMYTFIFFNNDDDQEFFQLALPNIYDVTEDNRELILEAANKVNCGTKVAKIFIVDDTLWASFESILDHSPEVTSIIERALGILMHARQSFYEAIQ